MLKSIILNGNRKLLPLLRPVNVVYIVFSFIDQKPALTPCAGRATVTLLVI